MGSIAIEAKGLRKSYQIYHGTRDKWRELLPTHREDAAFWALRDVDLRIEAGEAVGIIGVNGSGKTTLSNLIAGVAKPTGGELTVNGTTAMIAVSAGLNLRLTGLENIEMKGLLIGLSRQRIRELMPQIIAFADIGEHIDQPVKTYSSGMRSRLAFAISINIDPDILVIDEGLSVGDTTFVDRCLERMKRFQEDGKTMLLTGHSTAQLRDFCQRLIWLEGGRVRMDGPMEPVMAEYNTFIKWYRTLSNREQRDYTQQIRAGQRGRADGLPQPAADVDRNEPEDLEEPEERGDAEMDYSKERFSEGKYRMGYILREHPAAGDDPWLVCTFSAFPAAASPVKHQYSFQRVLADIPCHQLFLQDSLSEIGCYYLCADMDFAVADTVLGIIEQARQRLGVRKEHVVTVGSSKGGSAAYYFGLRGGYGHVIACIPQTKIATYLDHSGNTANQGQRMLDFMVGSHDKEQSYEKLDRLLPELLRERQETTVLHLFSSERDWEYPIHIRPLLDLLDLTDPRNDVTIDNRIQSHADFANYNADFVRGKLFEILFGVSVRWSPETLTLLRDGREGELMVWFAEAPERVRICASETVIPLEQPGLYTPVFRAERPGMEPLTYTLPTRLVGLDDFRYEGTRRTVDGGELQFEVLFSTRREGVYTFSYKLYREKKQVAALPDTADTAVRLPLSGPGWYTVLFCLKNNEQGWRYERRETFSISARDMERKSPPAETEREQMSALSRKELTALVEGVDLETMPDGVRVILRPYPEAELLGAQYGFYLLREGELLSRVTYQNDPECVFSDLEPGEYRVKCFIRVGQAKCSCCLRDVVV